MLKRGMPPTHPGEILRLLYLEPLGINQAEAADHLGVARKTLSMLLNGHQGISAEMALRLAKAFNTTPRIWLNLQLTYDLWHAEKKVKLSKVKLFPKIKKLSPARSALERKFKEPSVVPAFG